MTILKTIRLEVIASRLEAIAIYEVPFAIRLLKIGPPLLMMRAERCRTPCHDPFAMPKCRSSTPPAAWLVHWRAHIG